MQLGLHIPPRARGLVSTRIGHRWLAAVVGLVAMVWGSVQGLTYGRRLANPQGAHLVVTGLGPQPHTLEKPGRIVLVVIDGLRADASLSMRSTAWLQAHGTCSYLDVGELTKSRPEYVLLSSGVEPGRSGVRSNDVHTPAPVESIWQVARRAGYPVSGASAVSWWQELFPDGFDDYQLEAEGANLFAGPVGRGGFSLIHPCYVDDAGHDAGAASSLYREAVTRADGELLPFLQGLDLSRDAVVVTADHGHTQRGGHGGGAPELRMVLACAAGHGIAHTSGALAPTMDARTVPALLAVLGGLPLPRHLDLQPEAFTALDGMLDSAAFPPGHLSRYQRETEQRRATLNRQLSSWVREPPATWARLVQEGRRTHDTRFALSIGVGCLALCLLAHRRHRTWRGTITTMLWIALIFVSSYGLTRLTRGSFDLAAVNTGWSFVLAQALTSSLLLLAAGGLHFFLCRDDSRLLFDGVILAAAALVLSLAHLIGFGWPVSFPLPGPALLFLPYPLAALTTAIGAALLGLSCLRKG